MSRNPLHFPLHVARDVITRLRSADFNCWLSLEIIGGGDRNRTDE